MERITDKIFKITISIVVALSVLAPNIVAKAEGSILTLETSKESVKAGETFDLTVRLNPKYDLASMNFEFTYDNSSFALKTKTNGKVDCDINEAYKPQALIGANNPNPGNIIKVYIAGTEALTAPSDNRLLTVTFTALDNVDARGMKDFILKVTSATASDADISLTTQVQAESTNASINIEVPTTQIVLNKTTASLEKKDKLQLTATKNPTHTTDTNSIKWSSTDSSVASVDKNGLVTANKNGKSTITASLGNISASCEVVVGTKQTGVKIKDVDGSDEIIKGKTKKYVAVVIPEDATNAFAINWSSSDTEIATVSETGEVTAIKDGKTTITATSGEFKDSFELTVKKIDITSVSLDKTSLTFYEDDTVALNASILPVNTTEDKTLSWKSSNDSIVDIEVSQDTKSAILTGLKKGTATITVTTSNGKTASCSVKVKKEITDIEISGAKDLIKNETLTLTVSKLPTDADDEMGNVTWKSSNESIATINSKGEVTAKKAGSVTFTASMEYKGKTISKNIAITVSEIHIDKIILSFNEVEIEKGKTVAGPKVTWEPINTTDDTKITYSSEDSSIATVDKDGKIKAVAGGTTNIIVKVAGKEAKCRVDVRVPMTGIKAKISDDEVLKGKTTTVSYEVTPKDTTDSILSVNYMIDKNEIVSIDNNGVLTGLKEGKASITVEAVTSNGTYSDTVNVVVKEIHIDDVKLNTHQVFVQHGFNTQLTATFDPNNTTDDTTPIWTSSNKNVATVNENGLVYCGGPGKTTITVTIAGKTDTCEVIVFLEPLKNFYGEHEDISAEFDEEVFTNLVMKDLYLDFAPEIEKGEEFTVNIYTKPIIEENIDEYKKILSESDLNNFIIGDMFDISIYAYPTKQPERSVNLTELSEALEITVEIPTKLLKEGRAYKIIRIEDGLIEELPFNLVDGTKLQFNSLRYSTFAILYNDEPVNNETSNKPGSPETGDTSDVATMSLAFLISLGTIVLLQRRFKRSK